MSGRERIANTRGGQGVGTRGTALALALCVATVVAVAAMTAMSATPAMASGEGRQQMRALDEEIQEIKSDVLSISEELSRLEEKLLYPSGTQVAVFVSIPDGDASRLDAVRVSIDGELVAHYIYSAKESEGTTKGGELVSDVFNTLFLMTQVTFFVF